MTSKTLHPVEWPTLALLVTCYSIWALALFALPQISLTLAVIITGLAIALHSSLSHEVIHGHPFRNQRLNSMLVFPALALAIPYERFKVSHLIHHNDSRLTDPYDDPESNFMDPVVWDRLSGPARLLLRFNNTLAGRLLVGPLVGTLVWVWGDMKQIANGDRVALWGWLLHIPAVAIVVPVILTSPMPFWAYALAAYMGLAILKIRTFLEHRAHEQSRARTVVIEDKGPLALIFLNNNLHVVHHMHPRATWYQLPRLYAANPDRYLDRNEGYRYRSYAEVFARYLFKAKDTVPHPLWRR